MPPADTLSHHFRFARLDALGPRLLVLSCLYLTLPLAIFLAGWLKWWVAIPALAAMAVPCWETIRRSNQFFQTRDPRPDDPTVAWYNLLLLLIVAVVLAALSGMGGYGVQEGDYYKHNAVLRDLVEKPWPVLVFSEVGSFPMVYYTAWYLPAALVGKWAGWAAANHFMFLWGTTGLVLSMLWFGLLARRINWITIAVFVAFSGLDVLGTAIFKLVDFSSDPTAGWSTIEWSRLDWYSLRWWNWEIRWWAGPYTWNYSSHMAMLVWVPQQALGGWIVTGMILQGFRCNGDHLRPTQPFWLAVSSLWAPFVTVGLLPLVAADWLLTPRPYRARLRAWLSAPGLCGLALLGLMGAYYLARTAQLPFSNDPAARFRFFGNEDYTGLEFLARVLLFYVLEIGLIAMLAWIVHPPEEGRWRGLVLASLGFLFLLPFFRYGINNDLVMRVSIPCLMVVALLVAGALLARPSRVIWKLALVTALLLAAGNPFAEIYRHIREIGRRGPLLLIPEQAEVESLWELNCETREKLTGNDFFFRQYIGSPDAFFFRYLARDPVPANDPEREEP